MQRHLLKPRINWQREMEALGFSYHSMDGVYWDESRCYQFTESQIDQLEAATTELHLMSMNAVQQVISTGRWEDFAIPPLAVPLIEASWQAQLAGEAAGFSLFGRLDLSYDGHHPPKLLEYNADTPTACLEASVAQWQWLQALRSQLAVPDEVDQFNSLHEKLIAAWQRLLQASGRRCLHFTCADDSDEDFGNVNYLRDTAIQAGWITEHVAIEEIGVVGAANHVRFVDSANQSIELLFKLYPWEWLVREPFAQYLAQASTQWIEPPWKMLLANKALLVVLWELYPNHPNLLPASFDLMAFKDQPHVKKPKLAREGANIDLINGAHSARTAGPYGAEGYVVQALAPLPRFGDDYTLIGSWLVNGEPAGIGLREDQSPITCNSSRFVPHYFV